MIGTIEAYRRWAASYPPVAHNPLMRAEERLMREHWPPVTGKRVLDLACGSGRYARLLAEAQPAELVATDFCEPMLAQVGQGHRVCASMTQLPFVNACFDVVICGLAIGHTVDLALWMTEVARVLAPRGTLLYSDFHPAAARAGLPRSFKDQDHVTTLVPHCVHELSSQSEAAAAAGLIIETMRDVRVGLELTERFSGSDEFYGR